MKHREGPTRFARRDRVRRLKERWDQPMTLRQVRWMFRSFFCFVPSLIFIGLYGWNFMLIVPLALSYWAGRVDESLQMEQRKEENRGTKRSSSL